MEGKGSYRWASGVMKSEAYVGELKDNALSGSGKMIFRDKTIYKGRFNNNCM